ncbi:MAG: radical SAM protein [Kiritimatiellia bacterium]|nr:radical SAM protein [Kiritimatiellia bacterium]
MNNPLFRPPAEADSLILQIDSGCPHNRCSFCGMYRGMPYRKRPMDEVRTLIERESQRMPGAQRVFLADGDVMSRPFDELRAILEKLGGALPRLARVNLYANGCSIAAKTEPELGMLRDLRLHTLYMGLESGDEATLARCQKGETVAQMVAAGRLAQAAGLRMSVMVLLGLGGADRSREHAVQTSEALNRMQPRLLSALRVIPVEGTALHAAAVNGIFRQLTEWEIVRELRDLVAGLVLQSTVFRANHASNVIPIEARLPRDKERLLSTLESLLDGNSLDKRSPGKIPMWL